MTAQLYSEALDAVKRADTGYQMHAVAATIALRTRDGALTEVEREQLQLAYARRFRQLWPDRRWSWS